MLLTLMMIAAFALIAVCVADWLPDKHDDDECPPWACRDCNDGPCTIHDNRKDKQ